MFRNYFTVAWRHLVRNKLYSFINVLGLAIGLAACLVIALIVHYELSFDAFHADRERIYRVVSHIRFADNWHRNTGVAAPAPAAMKREVTGWELAVAAHLYYEQASLPNGQGKPMRLTGKFHNRNKLVVEPAYFQLFNYEWLQGSPTTSLREPGSVVLTDQQAQRYFGQEGPVLGRQVLYGDSVWATVTGVVRAWNQPSDFAQFTDFISFATIASNSALARKVSFDDQWGNTNSSSQFWVKLAADTDPAQVDRQLQAIADKYVNQKKELGQGRQFLLQPLAYFHFDHEYRHFARQAHLPTLYGLGLVAAVLLVIACINFVNLETAQAVYRAKEVGIRKTLGSSRWHLVVQFLGQTSLLSLLAVLLAVGLAQVGLHWLGDFVPPGLELRPSLALGLFFGGSWLLVSGLAGFYPALVLSGFSPMLALKSQVSAQGAGNRRAYLRKVLIVGQFTVSQAFIIGTLVVSRQIDFMVQKDLGFKKDEVVIVDIPSFWEDSLARRRKFTFIDELKRLPEVRGLSLTGNVIASSNTNTTNFQFKRGGQVGPQEAHRRSVDAEFIPLFGLKLLAGRNLVATDTMKEIVINETFMRQLGIKTPQEALGHELLNYNQTVRFPIVGVVQDFHIQPLREAIAPTYLASEQEVADIIHLKLQTKGRTPEQVQATIDKVKQLYQQTYPEVEEPFNYVWLDEQVSQFYAQEQRLSRLMGLATGLAVFISCLGLFGLTSYLINQRQKEVSIRKVLGATVLQVSTLLSKDFVKLVALAFGVAAPVAYYLAQQWLADFAYQAPLGWDLFALAGGGALGLAVLTVSYRAIRAALANPVDSLRNE